MGLNDIQLPASSIVDLYRSSLVESTGDQTTSSSISSAKAAPFIEPAAEEWKYLGENKKKILIVVDYKEAVHLPDEELTFLTGMLTACQLSLADVAIVNRNNYPNKEYTELKSHFQSRIIFLFGVDPVSFGLPMSFPHYQIQSFASATFLFTPALEERKKDELLKSKLWVCLRRIFVI